MSESGLKAALLELVMMVVRGGSGVVAGALVLESVGSAWGEWGAGETQMTAARSGWVAIQEAMRCWNWPESGVVAPMWMRSEAAREMSESEGS